MSKLEPTRTYSNHTATDVLRRLLDERGVEWIPVAWNPKRETFYHAANGVGFCADEYTDGVKIYTDATITPEQAIAATLGATDARPTQEESSGTCRIEYHYGEWYCTSCGEMVGTCDPDSELCVDGNYVSMWNFCPMCGRRIVQ